MDGELNSVSNYNSDAFENIRWGVAFGKNPSIMQLHQKTKKKKKKRVKRATLGRSFFAQCFISRLQAVEELKLASTAGRQRYTEVSTGR